MKTSKKFKRVKLAPANAIGVSVPKSNRVTAIKQSNGYLVITSYGKFSVKTLKEVKEF